MQFSLFAAVFSQIDTKILKSPQLYFHYVLMLLLMPVLVYRHRSVPKYILYFIVLASGTGIFYVARGYNSLPLLVKIIFIITFVTLYFYYFLREFRFDIEKVFGFYLKGAIVASIVFFIQHVGFVLGIQPLYNLSYLGVLFKPPQEDGFLPAAFMPEPAGIASVLCCALFIALHNVVTSRRLMLSYTGSILIIAALLFSGSSTGYLGMFFCFLLMAINYRKVAMIAGSVVIGTGVCLALYSYNARFKMRVDDSLGVFFYQRLTSEKQLKNGSTMALYNNLHIASSNFKNHPVMGTGLGSHPVAFGFYNRFDEDTIWWAELNKEDANSLFLRLMSETGLLGLALFFGFLVKFGVSKKSSVDNRRWLISNAILVFVFVTLLRQGNYVGYSIPFFLLMYYYNHKNNMRLRLAATSRPAGGTVADPLPAGLKKYD